MLNFVVESSSELVNTYIWDLIPINQQQHDQHDDPCYQQLGSPHAGTGTSFCWVPPTLLPKWWAKLSNWKPGKVRLRFGDDDDDDVDDVNDGTNNAELIEDIQ